MKPAETMEAPSEALAKEGSATPELFAHEWDGGPNEVKVCRNPERFAVDGMPAGTALVCLLGYSELYAQWFVAVGTDDDSIADLTLRSAGCMSFSTRVQAILYALDRGKQVFGKNRQAQKHLREFRARLEAGNDGEAVRRFLASVAPEAAAEVPVPEPAEVRCDAINFNPHNDRKDFPQDYLDELAASIEREGLLQRVGVRLLPSTEASLPGVPPAPRYRLLYGECRLRAVRQLARTTIRAEVYPATLSERMERRITKVENLKRRNLNPIEEAQGYEDAMREFGLTQEQMAQEVGKSRPVIANALRLLDLPEAVRGLLGDGALSPAHGTALCRFKAWPAVCAKLAELAIKHKAPAGTLEKNLPFGEELVEAKLAVDLNAEGLGGGALPKSAKSNPAIFDWEDKGNWDGYTYCLDVKLGEDLIAEEKKKRDAREAKWKAERGGAQSDRNEAGELTPAAKRARAKQLDENQAARLAVSAMGHAAVGRLTDVKEFDRPMIAVVAAEAMKHCGACDFDDIAARLGIKLPKEFDDGDPSAVAQLRAIDALRLAAAAIAQRETDGAMRYAGAVGDDVRELVNMTGTPEDLVTAWKAKIKALVEAGKRADDIQKELGIPDYLATTLTRVVKREAREAAKVVTEDPKRLAEWVRAHGLGMSVEAIAKTYKASVADVAGALGGLAAPKSAKKKAAKPAAGEAAKDGKPARAVITDGTRSEVRRLAEAGHTGAEIAKQVGISLPSVQNIKKALGLVKERA